MSRGLRNNNPGNIRRSKVKYQGEVSPSRDPEFKEFETMAYGYRAMFVLLDTYRSRYGLTTIRQMLNRYAPPKENFTEGYVRFVAAGRNCGRCNRFDTPVAHPTGNPAADAGF